MTCVIPRSGPVGAVLRETLQRIMEIILHLGAHRTATTSFQNYAEQNAGTLARQGAAIWTPRLLRKKIFSGFNPLRMQDGSRKIFSVVQRRVDNHLTALSQQGISKLMISDENMLGSMRENYRKAVLYPLAGQRVAGYCALLGPNVRRIILNVRSEDQYWASVIAYVIKRLGIRIKAQNINRIATHGRDWRDVITELAKACPGRDITVFPFEVYNKHPDVFLSRIMGITPPMRQRFENLNQILDRSQSDRFFKHRTPEFAPPFSQSASWSPFDDVQKAQLRENYSDTMFWLLSGADGLATLTEDYEPAIDAIKYA